MTAFTITVDDSAVTAELKRLADSARNPAPALDKIGTDLLTMTRRTFGTGTDPWGRPWKPTQRGNPPLIGDGRFLSGSSLHYNVSGKELTVGSSAIYAAIHQFGGKTRAHTILPKNKQALAFGGHVVKKVNHPGSLIPARPFFPIDKGGNLAPQAQQKIIEIIQEYLLDQK